MAASVPTFAPLAQRMSRRAAEPIRRPAPPGRAARRAPRAGCPTWRSGSRRPKRRRRGPAAVSISSSTSVWPGKCSSSAFSSAIRCSSQVCASTLITTGPTAAGPRRARRPASRSTGGGVPAAAISSARGLERLDLLHDELRLAALLVVEAAAHDHALVHRDVRLVRRVRGVEDQHLDLALEVVERREHHRLARLRADALRLHDQAADRHPRAVRLRRHLGQRAVGARAQQVAHLG